MALEILSVLSYMPSLQEPKTTGQNDVVLILDEERLKYTFFFFKLEFSPREEGGERKRERNEKDAKNHRITKDESTKCMVEEQRASKQINKSPKQVTGKENWNREWSRGWDRMLVKWKEVERWRKSESHRGEGNPEPYREKGGEGNKGA